mmetsp:Transcript_7366/g.11782  ORF Transcript_7366/g.11782 Transcript_7366/m.11782 type:complete len:387 (+) Transcript_7366:415-1575(+)|eukprot:CAMPEP_0203764364 /NCGR_PEP_ID=MMETSP0098-20131031/17644_1 /ASSEMBLY_ACC=CAM_ASM_000208 /TAXON_ID=96639 /ORGANISM=" , Strain NY0313808BC1" /LENGTH=386 /DNA_ID=CAMNT_0050660205 /DNA_START=332 /DNA_END=1492 /DNA_ORIENTATION=-
MSLVGELEVCISKLNGTTLTGASHKKTRQRLRRRVNDILSELAKLNLERDESANYVQSSTPGCYIAYLDAEWIEGVEDIDQDTFGQGMDLGQVPEIMVDPEELLLTVVNAESDKLKSFNISIVGKCLPAKSAQGMVFNAGETIDAAGNASKCLTFVLVVRPMQAMDVCYLNAAPVESTLLVSDVKLIPLEASKVVSNEDSPIVKFPLGGRGPYLCSQSAGGHFTHYFPGNFHAIDFECPIGTPIVAVGNGTVIEMCDSVRVEGIHTSNLFSWNSVLIQLDDSNLYVEYVHIQHSSCLVKVGDQVACGQIICSSGSVGFSPRPHLHFQVSKSKSKDAETVPFSVECEHVQLDIQNPSILERNIVSVRSGNHVIRAGNWYRANSQARE